MNAITTRDGVRIHYRDWGGGQPILFSHGWPLTGDAWEAQLLFFSTRGYRVIAHDRRGHGLSDQPGFGNDMDSYADDLSDLIAALDLHNLILVGHSTGGGEVARYIGRHGTGRVAKIVLIDAITPQMLRTEANPEGAPTELFEQIRAGLRGNRSSFYQELSAPFFGANRPGSTVPQGMRDLFWLQGMQGGLLGQYLCTWTWENDYSADLARFDVPTLVLHCEDDQVVPVNASARRMADHVPHAQVVIYPDGNHGIAITDPDRVNADLLAFIGGDGGEAAGQAHPEVLTAQPVES